jgi:hypothetical protein
MPKILKQLSRDETNEFPSELVVKFTRDEFHKFLDDPLTTTKDLGLNLDNLTIMVSSNAWVSGKWVKSSEQAVPAGDTCYICGYSDSMCVCYPVPC